MTRELTPWGRRESRQQALGDRHDGGPLFNFRREVDRLFDDFLQGWSPSSFGGGRNWPSLEVKDSDNEIRVTAELPGMSERDVELSIDEGVLTIRGERQQASDDKARGFSERYYGKFERRLALPRGIEPDKAEARFEHGELTVTIPKGPEAERGRRIPINAGSRH